MAVNGILGIKLGMAQVFTDDGMAVGCTVLQAGPCVVVQRRTKEKDGYDAAQLGLVEFIKPQRVTKPMLGHFKKSDAAPMRRLGEVRLDDSADETKAGDRVLVDRFAPGELVDVTGISKGKGFAGVMKRYHFGGQCASHGTERKHRSPGSIASRATWRGQCGKPKKGVRMAGHMGMDRVTTRNHPLIKIDAENNLLIIKGALPGPNGGLLFVRKSVTAKIKPPVEQP